MNLFTNCIVDDIFYRKEDLERLDMADVILSDEKPGTSDKKTPKKRYFQYITRNYYRDG